MTTNGADVFDASTPRPHVVLVVAHSAMRALIVELLHRDQGRWSVTTIDSVSEIGHDASLHPDLAIVDTADLATIRRHLPPSFAVARIVVIGPEPDPAYRRAALYDGAGEWMSRDCIAEELYAALRSALAGPIAPQVARASAVRTADTPEITRGGF